MIQLTFFIQTTSNLSVQVMSDEPFIPAVMTKQLGVFAVDTTAPPVLRRYEDVENPYNRSYNHNHKLR